MSNDGYSVNMRQDKQTGEYLAVTPSTYRLYRDGGYTDRFYIAFTVADGHVELSPEYLTKCTRTVTDYPESLKRYVDRRSGYILNIAPRLYG